MVCPGCLLLPALLLLPNFLIFALNWVWQKMVSIVAPPYILLYSGTVLYVGTWHSQTGKKLVGGDTCNEKAADSSKPSKCPFAGAENADANTAAQTLPEGHPPVHDDKVD
ncbi:MAG: hypothetical protein MHM6MM_002584 [Cercozoa sp. M6MM]